MSAEPLLQMNAVEQARYVGALIDKMFGNDVHERPPAEDELRSLVGAERHANDCGRYNGYVCDCGIREAKAFLGAGA